MQLKLKYPKGVAFIIGMLLGVALVASAELFYSFSAPAENALVYERPNLFCADPQLGWDVCPNAYVEARGFLDGDRMYEAVYTTDGLGRRKTPVANREDRNQFALFMGGSFAFGQGLADSDTLPYYLGRNAPEYMPYNYACPAHGPGHALFKLKNRDLRSEIREKNGVGIYVFVADQLWRLVGSMRHDWTWDFPYYALTEDGVELKGTFRTDRPIITAIYDLLSRSNILKRFNVGFPVRLGPKHYDLAAGILEEVAQTFLDMYPESEFYVLFYPYYYRDSYDGSQSHDVEQIRTRLERAGITCLDYSGDIFQSPGPGDELAYPETHPRGALHEQVSRKLIEALELDDRR